MRTVPNLSEIGMGITNLIKISYKEYGNSIRLTKILPR